MVHVVREGEHLSSIAATYKFRDFHTIWDDPANSELKLRRANPNVLFPGDRIYIPDKKLKSVGASTGRAHVFRVNAPSLVLRVQVVQLYGEPISHCDLTVESDVFHVESDAQGTVERRISATSRHGNLELHERIPTVIQHSEGADTASRPNPPADSGVGEQRNRSFPFYIILIGTGYFLFAQ